MLSINRKRKRVPTEEEGAAASFEQNKETHAEQPKKATDDLTQQRRLMRRLRRQLCAARIQRCWRRVMRYNTMDALRLNMEMLGVSVETLMVGDAETVTRTIKRNTEASHAFRRYILRLYFLCMRTVLKDAPEATKAMFYGISLNGFRLVSSAFRVYRGDIKKEEICYQFALHLYLLDRRLKQGDYNDAATAAAEALFGKKKMDDDDEGFVCRRFALRFARAVEQTTGLQSPLSDVQVYLNEIARKVERQLITRSSSKKEDEEEEEEVALLFKQNIAKMIDDEELRDELAREYSKNRYMFNVYEVLARGLRRRPVPKVQMALRLVFEIMLGMKCTRRFDISRVLFKGKDAALEEMGGLVACLSANCLSHGHAINLNNIMALTEQHMGVEEGVDMADVFCLFLKHALGIAKEIRAEICAQRVGLLDALFGANKEEKEALD